MKIVVAFVVLASVAAASAKPPVYENIRQSVKCTSHDCGAVSDVKAKVKKKK